MHTKYSAALAIASAAALAACAYPEPTPSNVPSYSQPARGSVAPEQQRYAANTGVVSSIELIRGQERSSGISPAGTIIGAVVGGLVGHQIGEGRGNTAATIGGAAVGGLAGNAIGQRTREGTADTYRVAIRYDNGGSQYIDVSNPGDLRTGDRVRVDGGQISRY